MYFDCILIRIIDSCVVRLLLPKSSDVHSKVSSFVQVFVVALLLGFVFSFSKKNPQQPKDKKAIRFTWSNRCRGYCSPRFPRDFVMKLKFIPEAALAKCCVLCRGAASCRETLEQLHGRDGPARMHAGHVWGYFSLQVEVFLL